jgi:hypothetical protein
LARVRGRPKRRDQSLSEWAAAIDVDGYGLAGQIPLLQDAARCLKYSRSRENNYDDIVFGVTHQYSGPAPFASMPTTRLNIR